MKIEAYITCIKRAIVTFIRGLIVTIGALFLTLLPIETCYSIYGIYGVVVGLLISILIWIFIALIEHEITEYKRWNDD